MPSKIVHGEGENLFGLPQSEEFENIVAPLYSVKTVGIHQNVQ